MSVIITNVSKHDGLDGLSDYVLMINRTEIARFQHDRRAGLAECLRKAADAAEPHVEKFDLEAMVRRTA